MSGRARVLSVIGDLGFGGGESRLLSLARHIDRERFDHKVLTILKPDPHNEESWQMRRHYREAGIEVIDLGEPRAATAGRNHWEKTAGLLRRIGKLRRLICDFDADVVDTHLEAAAVAGVAAARTAGGRVTVTLYHAHPLVPVRGWDAAAKCTLAAADAVITDSRVRASEIAQYIPSRRPKMLVIPNGIDPPRSMRTPQGMRARLGLPEDPRVKIVGQVSGLVEFKGHMVLIDAARRVLEMCPDTAFLFVGYVKRDTGYVGRLERKATECGVAERVRIAGYPDDIGDIWSVIDVHVHASLFDSLPNAIIEGMSLAKPAVVTNVGGVPEMVENGRTGLVVPSGDPVVLASALIQLLRRPDYAKTLGDAARARYLERCRPEIMVRRLETCFLELAGRLRPAAERECLHSNEARSW